MSNSPIIKVDCRDTAQKSKYTFSSRPKPRANEYKNYHDTVYHLTSLGYSFAEAEAVTNEAFAKASQKDTPMVRLAEFNDETREMFKYFRWYCHPGGTRVKYIRTSATCEEYAISTNLMASAHSTYIKVRGKEGIIDMDVYTWMKAKYRKLLNSGMLFKRPTKNPGGKTNDDSDDTLIEYTTLESYWETMAEEYWEQDEAFKLKEPPSEISTDPKRPCFYYFNENDLIEGETPEWDEWMLKIPEGFRAVWRAWIFSIFDPMNTSRQLLWITDKGYSGKSSVIDAISRYMKGKGHGAISQSSMADKFGYSTIYGKRFLTYGDAKNPKLIQTEKIHSLLGGDYVDIQFKGEASFTARVHARLLVAANLPPEINLHMRNEVTRLIYIPLGEDPDWVKAKYATVDPKTGKVVRDQFGNFEILGGNLAEKLFKEMPMFLFKCRQDYYKLCPHRQDIKLSQELKQFMYNHCTSPDQVRHEEFCQSVFDFHYSYWMKLSDLQEEMKKEGYSISNSSYDYSNVLAYLEKGKGCTRLRSQVYEFPEDLKQAKICGILRGVRQKSSTNEVHNAATGEDFYVHPSLADEVAKLVQQQMIEKTRVDNSTKAVPVLDEFIDAGVDIFEHGNPNYYCTEKELQSIHLLHEETLGVTYEGMLNRYVRGKAGVKEARGIDKSTGKQIVIFKGIRPRGSKRTL